MAPEAAGTSSPATIGEAATAIRAGRCTCVELTAVHLDRIARLDPVIHAFVVVTADDAMRQAARLDADLAAGVDRGPLHGIPIAVKDLFDVAGLPTTVGSRSLASSRPKAVDAQVVRLLRTAGAVILGKNNLAEFAADMTGRNEAFGDMGNPWSIDHTAGGSSGGTAAAVASGMCLGGVGSDTGGSIRFPASVCGVVGIRPTRGLVSLDGAFPRAITLDAAGPIARTVDDAAMLLDAMTGRGGSVDGRVPTPKPSAQGVDGVRVGVVDGAAFRGVEPEVAAAFRSSVDSLSRSGADVVNVETPLFDASLDHRRLFDILLYEFHQILGERLRNARDPSLFGPVVRDNLRRGARVSRHTYEEALAARSVLASTVRETFASVDVVVTPTQPIDVPRLDADVDAFEHVRRFLLPTSFVGLPSISVPCGFSDGGLPIGLQVIGDYNREDVILRVAGAVENRAGAAARLPPWHPGRPSTS